MNSVFVVTFEENKTKPISHITKSIIAMASSYDKAKDFRSEFIELNNCDESLIIKRYERGKIAKDMRTKSTLDKIDTINIDNLCRCSNIGCYDDEHSENDMNDYAEYCINH